MTRDFPKSLGKRWFVKRLGHSNDIDLGAVCRSPTVHCVSDGSKLFRRGGSLFLQVAGWYGSLKQGDSCGNWQKKTPDPRRNHDASANAANRGLSRLLTVFSNAGAGTVEITLLHPMKVFSDADTTAKAADWSIIRSSSSEASDCRGGSHGGTIAADHVADSAS